ncbi:acetoacetyl-CoA synthetase-like protein [Eremomyces bilateralis CBS 781.70]|uniref:Acetoacetyl-CoA synthetase-like protein n=1 Tax=Eremomyces bilateralis CBS 781.70 TaxID=1392243 RepID=A0A6G1G5L6_9PEZI|nr:acetoacetyl-CoA synthetase-like protein [Eremomyces bilateralis CBS 781.70]KAF1813353.1 acetoacetyl-CoA synthetase-like protein [Eremomyces bilateralis CBS 781.70]
MGSEPIWVPSNTRHTGIHTFRLYVNRTYSLNLQTYDDLHKWSVMNIPDFAEALFVFAGIHASTPYLRPADGVDTMYPPPRWFPGARLNYTENILKPGLGLRPNGIAVTVCDEDPSTSVDITFLELERQTALWATALRNMGVGVGDRVATVLPNKLDCLLVLLAAGSIGAIFSSTSPDMGATGIIERYKQVRPKVLVCDTVVTYAGKKIDLRKRLFEANKKLSELVPELQHTLVANGPIFEGQNVKSANSVLAATRATSPRYEQLPFDHPIYILYTSGTTGTPKCITHAAGRALLQQKKELILTGDVKPNSTYYQYTTTGWMMWNWVVAVLSVGGRIILYDGSPLHPTPSAQIELIKKQDVTHWGTSPKFLAALRRSGLPKDMDLPSLCHVGSAGSPLSAELHRWFADTFPAGVGLTSGSGGTDLVGGIVSGSPITNIYPGEISVPNLGMKVEIWDSSGRNIEDSGEKGDLVITKPFFSMPIGFWGENGKAKYRAAYFEQYPGVWYHGDFIRKIPGTNGYEILGRSDGVLNPGGVRFGSAEIYGILDKFEELQDFLCVAQKLPPTFQDEQVLLFIMMAAGKRLDDSLLSRIKQEISRSLSLRHVPGGIHEVHGIPYTVNGKRIENLVRDIVAGKSVGEARTAINPECLKEYENFRLGAAEAAQSKL